MFTLSSALKACSALGFHGLGMQLHSTLIKMDSVMDSHVRVGLIDMYCKCGLMKDAGILYNLMPEKDLIALNAMISGYLQNGEDGEALNLFVEMYNQKMGFDPASLLAVLNATAGLQNVHVCRQIHILVVKSGYQSDNFVLNSLVDSYGKCSHVGDASRVFEECINQICHLLLQ
ncbi:unnamed protein product [Fraxinus pennsylvanica]|uniref:Pentatricopeptide repeat-containing protein n=1 Tax=Fraxinus pennsylvanica TaxID=56036 RepID=A0AAD2DFR0_9LAMI|nr:unnamed protein product [Fraxinus pennsylvanica]